MSTADFQDDYSTQKISPSLVSKIIDVLRNKAYGSVEIYIENYNVTQITERNIIKLTQPKSRGRRFSIKVIKQGSFSSSSQRPD
jgi:hypothetical protein